MKENHTAKLDACEAKLRRWHTRLTRASNAIAKLVKQRQRLMAKLAAAPAKPMTTPMIEATANLVQAIDDGLTNIIEGKPADLDIPPFLKRKPVDAAALTAQRKVKEADAKKKMPLTGKAAIDYVKVKRKKTA